LIPLYLYTFIPLTSYRYPHTPISQSPYFPIYLYTYTLIYLYTYTPIHLYTSTFIYSPPFLPPIPPPRDQRSSIRRHPSNERSGEAGDNDEQRLVEMHERRHLICESPGRCDIDDQCGA